MKNLKQEEKEVSHESGSILNASLRRRSFLQYAGAGAAGVAFMAAGCSKDKDYVGPEEPVEPGVSEANLGSGDKGVLNYAYALEQLEAAFYTKVVESPWANMDATEKDYLKDIQLHEIAHRELLKSVLGADAIGTLAFDFSSITFSDRAAVLATAQAFEDLGVSAYNGAAFLLDSPDYLAIAAKIVSVEARHAAAIRETIKPNSFAETVVSAAGMETSRTPTQVLAIASKYITTKINASSLPTS